MLLLFCTSFAYFFYSSSPPVPLHALRIVLEPKGLSFLVSVFQLYLLHATALTPFFHVGLGYNCLTLYSSCVSFYISTKVNLSISNLCFSCHLFGPSCSEISGNYGTINFLILLLFTLCCCCFFFFFATM